MQAIGLVHMQAGPGIEDSTATQAPGAEEASAGTLAGAREEAAARSPLMVAALRALGSLESEAFCRHLRRIFPLLTRLISCPHSPPEVQRALTHLFATRIGPLMETA